MAKEAHDAYFDRWDVVEAWYVWLCAHHCGVVSSKEDKNWWHSYNRLSMMSVTLRFTPAPSLSLERLTENSRAIYNNLCLRAGFCDCLKENNNEC